MKRLRAAIFPILALSFLSGLQPAWAQRPVYYHGGPYLKSFTIVPVFWGDWDTDALNTQYTFLQNLAAYISGVNEPAGDVPTTLQYGVLSASVSEAYTANTPGSSGYVPPSSYISPCPYKGSAVAGTFYTCDAGNVITGLQGTGEIPAFSPTSVIMLFLGKGFLLNSACCGASFHSALGPSQYYGVVPKHPVLDAYPAGDKLQAVTSHEVFEAATDPGAPSPSTWAWVTAPYNSAGQVYEVADQCSSVVSISWPGAPGDTLRFAQIVDNLQGAICTTTGYDRVPFLFPSPIWPGTILTLEVVAGPVTPPPGTPVELGLSFVDLNGNTVGQPTTVQLAGNQVQPLNLNASLLVGPNSAGGVHADVRPVITPVGDFLPAVQATVEVYDSSTGAGHLLTSAAMQQGGPGQLLGPQGLAGGETMRIVAVAYPVDPCIGTLSFADQTGAPIGPSLPVSLAPGHGMPLDVTAASLGVQTGQRIEVQPRFTLTSTAPAAVNPVRSACALTAEVFNSITGQTLTYQTALVTSPPPSIPNGVQ